MPKYNVGDMFYDDHDKLGGGHNFYCVIVGISLNCYIVNWFNIKTGELSYKDYTIKFKRLEEHKIYFVPPKSMPGYKKLIELQEALCPV